ncbi:MAG: glycosyltransferase [Candidatus Saganbacteria bacterium]|nr:glycosyltransferase [Candidatus Saganbacteria bacterium]
MRKELERFKYKPKFSFILPAYNTKKKYLKKILRSISSQNYENWEACVVNDGSSKKYVHEILKGCAKKDRRFKYKKLFKNTGIASATNEALKIASGDYIVFVDHDDKLEKDLLPQIVNYLQEKRDIDLIYTDSSTIKNDGDHLSCKFKPDWSPELLYAYLYFIHPIVFSKEIIKRIGSLEEKAQDYKYVFRATENTNIINHIPLLLYHWRKHPDRFTATNEVSEKGRKAMEEHLVRKDYDWAFADLSRDGIYKLSPSTNFSEKVSIIIHSGGDHKVLKNCVDSIKAKSSHKNYEIIITGNAGLAKGEYLLFLDPKTKIIRKDWIEQMLLYGKIPGVGIVGAKLVSGSGKIVHAGQIWDPSSGSIYDAFKDMPVNDNGYMEFAGVPRNYSAVSDACLLIKKKLFMDAGGFDKSLSRSLSGADLCFKVLSRGARIVYSPFAELLYCGDPFRGDSPDIKERAYFKDKWQNFPERYYNINQSFKNGTFKTATGKNNRMHLFDLDKKKIKMLSVIDRLNIGGAQNVMLAINRHLSKQSNFEVQVMSSQNGPLFNDYKRLNMKAEIVDTNWKTDSRKFMAFREQLKDHIKKGRFDIVNAHGLRTFWAIDAAHQAKVPSIWSMHDSLDYNKYFDDRIPDKEIRRIAKDTFVRSNRNIFGCNSTAGLFKKYDRYGTSDIIYNGVDHDKIGKILKVDKRSLKKKLNIPLNKKIVSMIGNVEPRKGQLDLAKAALEILTERNDVCFLIIGAKEESDYIRRIKNLIKDNKNIRSIKETPDVLKYFRISDVFAFTSYSESFPLVILLAMGFSLPIVTTPVFGISEQIENGKSGLFFRPGNVGELAEKIAKLLDDRKLAERLGENAGIAVKSLFDEKEMVGKYRDLIQTVAFEEIND